MLFWLGTPCNTLQMLNFAILRYGTITTSSGERINQASACHWLFVTTSLISVILAQGVHLFPFRTEKLSPVAPMVLPMVEE